MMAIPARATCRLSETQVRRKPVIVLIGPTAVGKSRVAVEVAKAFETEVLTADSWDRPYPSIPDVWFHDLLQPDGRPFRDGEIQTIRQLTGGAMHLNP